MTQKLIILIPIYFLVACAHSVNDLEINSVEAVDYRTDINMPKSEKENIDRFYLAYPPYSSIVLRISFQTNWQPDAMICVRNLIDVFQLGAFYQQNTVRHSTACFLLT